MKNKKASPADKPGRKENTMENLFLTTDELRTLCLMCQKEAAQIAVREHHKNLRENETYQRILSISRKAYGELIDRGNEE